MSLNVLPLDLIRSKDPVLDLSGNGVFSVYDGPAYVNKVVFVAQNTSSTSLTVQCSPPSAQEVVHPVIWKKYEMELKVTYSNTSGGNVATPYFQSAVAAGSVPNVIMRQFPGIQITNTEQITINGTSFMTNMAQYGNAFLRFSNMMTERAEVFSSTPSQLDYGMKYSDLAFTLKSPFAKYQDSNIEDSRASYNGYAVVTDATIPNGASGTSTITLTWFEPIMLSPLWFNKRGFTDIKNMTYTAVFGDLTKALSIQTLTPIAGLTIDSVACAMKGFELHFTYLTPKLLEKVSKQLSYDYNEVLVVQQQASSITAGASSAQSISALNLEAIPRRLIIWVEDADASTSLAQAQRSSTSKFRIDTISLQFGNQSGLLSNCNSYDLYQISRKNGSNLTWSQWSKYIGSYLALDLGVDIGLDSTQSVSLLSNPQLSFKLNYTNISDATIAAPIVRCAIIYEGSMSIINGNVVKQVAVLSQNDVLKSQSAEAVEYLAPQHVKNYFGGIDLASAMAVAKPVATLIRGLVQKGLPFVKQGADFLEKVGVGKAERMEEEYEASMKGAKIGGKKGKGIIGGKVITRQQLQNNLEDMY
jgi:hypothetical protein